MPNWCSGDLRIRGKAKNIVKFLVKEIRTSDMDKFPIKWRRIGDCFQLVNPKEHSIFLKGSRRLFIKEYEPEVLYENPEKILAMSIPVDQAWFIDANELAEYSKKYQIDFRILAFENGCHFNLDIEIIQGEITKNNEITFDDYDWECPCPLRGG